VKKMIAFLSAAAAGFGLVRALTRRRELEASAEEAPSDPRADELRRRLEASRDLLGEREQFESGETTVDAVDAGPVDPDERRRAVHEQGREAVERMRRPPE
jgi:hypothetical protein